MVNLNESALTPQMGGNLIAQVEWATLCSRFHIMVIYLITLGLAHTYALQLAVPADKNWFAQRARETVRWKSGSNILTGACYIDGN